MVEQASLAPLRICIFSPEEGLRDSLGLNAEGSGYRVEQSFNEPQRLVDYVTSSNADHIILIDVREQREERLRLMREIYTQRPLAMVAVSDETDWRLGERVIEAGAQALLRSPVRAQDLQAALTVAVHQQAKQAKLESEIASLQEKLAERKLIEKAKGILMASAKVTEAEAFRLIQKQSQEKRKRMAEIAMLIISAAELVDQARARAD